MDDWKRIFPFETDEQIVRRKAKSRLIQQAVSDLCPIPE
jgi:hypothetical protein